MAKFVNGKSSNHYITSKYIDIIEHSNELKGIDKKNIRYVGEVMNYYQKICDIYFSSTTKNISKMSEKGDGILEGLGQKSGLIRGNAMGKRVNHCARFVAGPSILPYGKLGVPKYAAGILLVPETVTRYNRRRIQDGIENGKYFYMTGYKDGVKARIEIAKVKVSDIRLEVGNIVERHIEDNDVLMSGRQPTLHAASIMGFRGVIVPKDTIGLHSSNDGPFNCDYDGDELTIHVPQTIRATIEAMTVASTEWHILNEQSNRPMVGIAFHGLLGGYLMTQTWKFEYDVEEIVEEPKKKQKSKRESAIENSIEEKSVKQLRHVEEKREVIIPERRWIEALSLIKTSIRKKTLERRCRQHNVNPRSGRALASIVLPINFTYKGNGLDIRDGIFVDGFLNKGNIGTKEGSIVQVICKLFSLKEGNRFISEFTTIADWFVMWHGFSLGQQSFYTNRSEILRFTRNEVSKSQVKFYNLGDIPKDEVELFFWKKRAHDIFNSVKEQCKKAGNLNIAPNNALTILGEGGAAAKGSYSNTAEITACLGNQQIKSDFQEAELNAGTRRLITFLPGDCSVESYGFVIRSFYDGLSPSEMYFHLAASRVGLIDTANMTAIVGYTHRRIMKTFEDIEIGNRGMTISTTGKIYQFSSDFSNVSLQEFTKTDNSGKMLSFCNFKNLANNINGMYEYMQRNPRP